MNISIVNATIIQTKSWRHSRWAYFINAKLDQVKYLTKKTFIWTNILCDWHHYVRKRYFVETLTMLNLSYYLTFANCLKLTNFVNCKQLIHVEESEKYFFLVLYLLDKVRSYLHLESHQQKTEKVGFEKQQGLLILVSLDFSNFSNFFFQMAKLSWQ